MNKEIIDSTRKKILKHTTIDQLLQDLNNNDENVKLRSITQLGYVQDENIQHALENLLLQSASSEIRIASAKSLGLIQSMNSISVLSKALQDENLKVRVAAALSLAKIGEKSKSLKFFSELSLSENDVPRYTCHLALLYIGTDEVQPLLYKDLNNPDSFIVIDAAIILAELGYKRTALLSLQKGLRSGDKYVRMASLRGLAYIGDEQSLQLIRTLSNDKEKLVRDRVHMILAKF